jgi:hypothetical protein
VEARGRVELSGPQAAALAVSKNVHTALVVAAVLMVVKIVGGTTDEGVARPVMFGLPFVAFWRGGLADARRPTAGATAKAACLATGEALAGAVGYGVLFLVWSAVTDV